MKSKGGILRLMPAAVGRGFYAPGTELNLRPIYNLSGKESSFKHGLLEAETSVLPFQSACALLELFF
jgi:hypothetical protein